MKVRPWGSTGAADWSSAGGFSVGVVGDEVFPVVEIIPKDGWYDYTNKYEPGATEEVCPADITTEQTIKMQTIAKDACDCLGCEVYARADIIMTENGDMALLDAQGNRVYE